MLIFLPSPSRFSLTFTNTGAQTALTSGVTWGNCLPLFCVHPAISGWKYPLFLLHLPECWAVPHRPEKSWLSPPGAVAELVEMHRAKLPVLLWHLSDPRFDSRSCASGLELLEGISKGFPQQFAGAAVINAGKDEDWISLIVLKVYCGILKSEFLHNLMCCSGYFQLKTFRIS